MTENSAKPLKQFLEISEFMIRNWSLEYKPDYYNIQNNTKYNNPNLKSFAYYPDYTTFTIKLKLFTTLTNYYNLYLSIL